MMLKNEEWSGFVAIEDTKLFVKDTGGSRQPIVYLNGAYANQKHWKKVVNELGVSYRHITYDERARGRSKKSQDYSFDACLRDLTAVIEHRKVEKPILVGWSYGGILAVHWVHKYPTKASGIVAVDSAVPYGLTGKKSRQRIYELFDRIKWILPFVAPFGLAARISAKQHAEVNIELNEISAKLEPVLLSIEIPVRYILAPGVSRSGEEHEFEEMRESITPLLSKNRNLKIETQVKSNHEKILAKDYKAISNAISKLTKELNGSK
ncbi:MAG: alpha/beta hydrolase [Cytophagales bacterium]|nr:alpha/beta hydrolase [Cytophagales bacterium]